jgi:N utilization substance protein A
MRVQSVVQELRGEKIDIIPWTDDQVQFVRNALSPAKVARVYMNDDEKTMQVVVPNDQLSLAIGKRGQNVRLAAKLTHWKIDIMSEDEADADSERLEALRRAQLAFSSPKRLVTTEATQGAVEENVLVETVAEETQAAEGAVRPQGASEDAAEVAEESMNTTAEAEMSEALSEDEVEAVGMEDAVSSEAASVSESSTEKPEAILLDEDNPERSDESEM